MEASLLEIVDELTEVRNNFLSTPMGRAAYDILHKPIYGSLEDYIANDQCNQRRAYLKALKALISTDPYSIHRNSLYGKLDDMTASLYDPTIQDTFTLADLMYAPIDHRCLQTDISIQTLFEKKLKIALMENDLYMLTEVADMGLYFNESISDNIARHVSKITTLID